MIFFPHKTLLAYVAKCKPKHTTKLRGVKSNIVKANGPKWGI